MPQPKPERKLEDRFAENVSRYPFYFVTVLLGGSWMLVKPFVDLYKKSPAAAALVSTGAIGLLIGVYFVLQGMLGDPWVTPGYSDLP
jgi:hypothetical protein